MGLSSSELPSVFITADHYFMVCKIRIGCMTAQDLELTIAESFFATSLI
jgi:hypothetical protein